MTTENQQPTQNEAGKSKTNTGLIIGIIVLAIIAVVLVIVLINGNKSGDDTANQPPLEGIATPIPGGPTVTATTNVNVRSGPGTNYDVYGVMQAGQTAAALAVCSDSSWWAIQAPVATGYGWVSADYVSASNVEGIQTVDCPKTSGPVPTPAPDQPSVTATTLLNVRKGPGTDFESYGLLQPGQSAVAIGTNADGTWFAIDIPPAPDGMGWVSAEYVTANNTDGLPIIE